jgi:hypothetical protein
MTFTVEVKNIQQPDRLELELYLDREALEDLLKQLTFLKAKGDHAHFFTASWGGMPLTELKQHEEHTLVNHLRVTLV